MSNKRKKYDSNINTASRLSKLKLSKASGMKLGMNLIFLETRKELELLSFGIIYFRVQDILPIGL